MSRTWVEVKIMNACNPRLRLGRVKSKGIDWLEPGPGLHGI